VKHSVIIAAAPSAGRFLQFNALFATLPFVG